MQSVCISIVAFSATENQYETFNNILSLAIKCAGDALYLGELADANLLVIWVKSEEDRQVLGSYQEDYPPEQLIVIASDEFAVDAYWYVSYPQNSQMPSVLGITNLLSRIQAFFFLNQEFDRFFLPDESLYGLIQEAVQDGVARKCTYPSCPDLYIAPQEQAFYLQQPLDTIIPMILADRQTVMLTDLSDEQLANIVSYAQFSSRLPQYVFLNEEGTDTFHRYPLKDLQAFVILIASQGRILSGHSLADSVFLKRQPDDFGLAEYDKVYKAIADCMGGRPLTLKSIAEKTQCPLFQVIGFYNVCSVFDLIGEGESIVSIESYDDTVFIAFDDVVEVTDPIESDESDEVTVSTGPAEWLEANGIVDPATWSETDGMIGTAEEAGTAGLFDSAEWLETDSITDTATGTETDGMIGTAEEAGTAGLFDATESLETDGIAYTATWAETDGMIGTAEEAGTAGLFDTALSEAVDETEISVAESPSAPISLESLFNERASDLNGRIKIIIAGGFGAGKSMAIATLCDGRPITTETRLRTDENAKKATTTVALDYGKMRLHDGLALILYGTPGLRRFDFMLPILCENAWGIVLLIDNTDADPLAELDRHLKRAEKILDKIPAVIGITHCDINAQPSVADYKIHLAKRGLAIPVMQTDARDRESLVNLIAALAA
jgi:signal recognition particle receptor subunit beta